MKWFGSIDDAYNQILLALRSLLDCPKVFHPFVVIDSGERSVQFAGSEERGLLFDVPRLGIVAAPIGSAEEGALTAVAALRLMDVIGNVTVAFESTRNRKMGTA